MSGHSSVTANRTAMITEQLTHIIASQLNTTLAQGKRLIKLSAKISDDGWFVTVTATRFDLEVEGDQVMQLQMRISPAVPVEVTEIEETLPRFGEID